MTAYAARHHSDTTAVAIGKRETAVGRGHRRAEKSWGLMLRTTSPSLPKTGTARAKSDGLSRLGDRTGLRVGLLEHRSGREHRGVDRKNSFDEFAPCWFQAKRVLRG